MHRRPVARGFTLIELMVAIAVAGLLVLLAAPSFQDMILMQRLRGVNAQLITDLQYARAEAVLRGRYVRVNLARDTTQTCYTVFSSRQVVVGRCDCTQGPGQACPRLSGGLPDPDFEELKTVTVPRSGGVVLDWPPNGTDPSQDADNEQDAFAFDFVTGGLVTSPTDLNPRPAESRTIDARVDDARMLRNVILQTGRPHVCAPNSQRMQVAAC